jgi:hypothetical protein
LLSRIRLLSNDGVETSMRVGEVRRWRLIGHSYFWP